MPFLKAFYWTRQNFLCLTSPVNPRKTITFRHFQFNILRYLVLWWVCCSVRCAVCDVMCAVWWAMCCDVCVGWPGWSWQPRQSAGNRHREQFSAATCANSANSTRPAGVTPDWWLAISDRNGTELYRLSELEFIELRFGHWTEQAMDWS